MSYRCLYPAEEMIQQGEAETLGRSLARMRRARPDWILWEERRLNIAGYHFLQEEKYDTAIALFRLNVDAFPQSFNVYDSLCEAHMRAGQTEAAIRNYKQSLEINPENHNAEKMLDKLRSMR